MFNLPWQSFDFASFQRFCNSLLWLEIGDAFTPFDAPGRDGGIDGLFNGTYKRKKGPWRFQYKFHNTARKTAVSTLKAELKAELAKLNREKQFVVLTNVSLLPAERQELENIVKTELTALELASTTFQLWDGATLSQLFLKHPLLKLWMEEGYSTASLVPYKIKFNRQLTASPLAIDTLCNFFVSRGDDLKQLHGLLNDSAKHSAILKGEAGIGKTRLAIEFLSEASNGKPGWRCLCLNNYVYNLDKIRFALGGGGNYVVLVDDAHNLTTQQLGDLYTLAGPHNDGTVKIVFTVRSLFTTDAFYLIKPLERQHTLTIMLDKLSKEEAKKAFEAHLNHEYLSQFIEQLVLISRGRPILIVGILNAAEKRQNIATIKSHEGFAAYVLEYFDSLLKTVGQTTGTSNLKMKQLLGLVCLLEPLTYSDSKTIKAITQQEDVSEELVQHFFEELRKLNFSAGIYQQSIKPDYYSDIFLKSIINAVWLEKKISQYPDFRANILTNVASLDEIESSDSLIQPRILDNYLHTYVNEMDSVQSTADFKERLHVIHSITFQQPLVAKSAVLHFIAALQNKQHCFYKNFIEGREPSSLHHNTEFNLVKAILTELLFQIEYYDFVFDSMLELYRLTKDKTLSEIFSYQHPVYLHQSSIQVQKFFVKRAEALSSDKEPEILHFIIEGLRNLLKLSFTATKWGILKRDTIQIFTYYLPQVPLIEQHRLKILDVAKQFYQRSTGEGIKLEALKTILDVPRETSYNKRNGNSYKSDKEVEFILTFLEQEAKTFSLSCQKEIKDELYWYKRQRVDKKFHGRIGIIDRLLEPKNLSQRLAFLFSSLEHDMEDRSNNTRNQIDKLLQEYSGVTIADALCELFTVPDIAFLYPQTVQQLTVNHPDKAFEAYNKLKVAHRAVLLSYGSYFLRSLRIHNDNENYWKEVGYWLKDDSPETINVVLHTYNIYVASKVSWDSDDCKLIERLCAKKLKEIEFNAAHALPVLYLVKGEESEATLTDFLGHCQQVNAEHLFRLLFHEFESNTFLTTLFLKNSIRFALSHFMEHDLVKIGNHVSVEQIFDYFLQRLEHQLSLPSEERLYYNFVPVGGHPYFIHHLEVEKRYALFELALSWFTNQKGDWWEKHYGENLVEFLMPSHDVDEKLTALYRKVYEHCKTNPKGVLRLAETLSTFHNKSQELFAILSYLITDAAVLHESNKGFLAQLRMELKIVITSAGCKSGTPGQPFPFDLRLKKLLEEAMPAYESHSDMKSMLSSALRETEATIARDTERDREDEW